jgi:hypothetical protein
MLKTIIAVGTILAAALAASPGSAMRPSTTPHVQQVNMTILPGDRILEGNIALAPGVPARMTVTNYTRDTHTFTVPGLHLNEIIPPPAKTIPHGRRSPLPRTTGARSPGTAPSAHRASTANTTP